MHGKKGSCPLLCISEETFFAEEEILQFTDKNKPWNSWFEISTLTKTSFLTHCDNLRNSAYLPTLYLRSSIMASMYILSKSTSSSESLAQLVTSRSGHNLEAVMIWRVLSINPLGSLGWPGMPELWEITTLGGLGWSSVIRGGGRARGGPGASILLCSWSDIINYKSLFLSRRISLSFFSLLNFL